jgi:hypothetical protein
VLKDLVDSGLLYRTGRGDGVIYRAAEAARVTAAEPALELERLANFVWVSICRHEPVSEAELSELLPVDPGDLRGALAHLVDGGRVRRIPTDPDRYESTTQVIEDGDATGWEAALFDHYQAMVTAFCTKLQLGPGSPERDWVGGSTFRFEVWDGHPLKDEVTGFLARVRQQGTELRARVAAYNQTQAAAEQESLRVLAYVGQTVIASENGAQTDE